MKVLSSSTFASTVLLVVTSGANGQSCPPPLNEPIDNFDIDSFISAPWYSVKQTPVSYQPENQFYCVRAQYTEVVPLSCQIFGWLGACEGETYITVENSARRGSVTGSLNSANLQGVSTDTSMGGLEVGFPFLPRFLWGPYWVVAAGSLADLGRRLLHSDEEDKASSSSSAASYVDRDLQTTTATTYDWAIISGGAADVATENGACVPGLGPNNGDGFWIFSRDPTPSADIVAEIVLQADMLGYDTSTLLDVEQAGCWN